MASGVSSYSGFTDIDTVAVTPFAIGGCPSVDRTRVRPRQILKHTLQI